MGRKDQDKKHANTSKPQPVVKKCKVGGVIAGEGGSARMAACGYSMVGQGCGLPAGESCEHQRGA